LLLIYFRGHPKTAERTIVITFKTSLAVNANLCESSSSAKDALCLSIEAGQNALAVEQVTTLQFERAAFLKIHTTDRLKGRRL
jgi:hypothetical protein